MRGNLHRDVQADGFPRAEHEQSPERGSELGWEFPVVVGAPVGPIDGHADPTLACEVLRRRLARARRVDLASAPARLVHESPPRLPPACHVDSERDQQLHDLKVALERGPMQRRLPQPSVVQGVDVRPALHQKAHHALGPVLRGDVYQAGLEHVPAVQDSRTHARVLPSAARGARRGGILPLVPVGAAAVVVVIRAPPLPHDALGSRQVVFSHGFLEPLEPLPFAVASHVHPVASSDAAADAQDAHEDESD
mmetsp:Transcript_14371/g.36349  ORF Transcript_14371/g.36349 Transcript_14371/m.36349 type:complete len:251 (+) Transcript_14371:439-1191(+)